MSTKPRKIKIDNGDYGCASFEIERDEDDQPQVYVYGDRLFSLKPDQARKLGIFLLRFFDYAEDDK